MSKNILIVEDEKPLQQVLSKKLSKEGWNVLQAFNGKEGIEMIDKNNIDLVLLDIIMPIMDGFEMLKVLRENDKYSKIKVIVLTNSASFEKVFDDNNALYLIKSNHTLEQLVEKIKEVI